MPTENNNEKKFTQQQKDFYEAKKLLDYFDKIELERDLTKEEQDTCNLIKTDLWQKVYGYAKSLIASSTQYFSKPQDYMEEIVQIMAEKFFIHLPKYDPLYCTPTTFFKPYFREAITDFKRFTQPRVTQNDANNIRKITNVVKEYEKRKEPYDKYVLSLETGLSLKVINNTLALMQNSTIANLDDFLNLGSKMATPEEEFLDKEMKGEIFGAIDETLTDFEKEFLFTKVDILGDKKDKNIKEMAEIYGKSEHEIKSIWSNIQKKLTSHDLLKKMHPKKEDDDLVLNVHTNATNDMEDDVFNAITNL